MSRAKAVAATNVAREANDRKAFKLDECLRGFAVKQARRMAAAGDISRRLGNEAEATRLRSVAAGMVVKWEEAAKEGEYYRLAFDRPGTWSQKYNLVWDTLLGYQLFPDQVRRRELPEFYGMFGMMALTLLLMALSAAGLYSLMSVAVTRRTREIGIRLAIGASPRAVLRALFGRAAAQVGMGIILALALLPPFMTWIGISELPLAFVAQTMSIAAVGMLLTGFVACSVPARRAMLIEPTEAVKYGG